MSNRNQEEKDRLLSGVAGGAIMGALISGSEGAFIGGIIGGLWAEAENRKKRGYW